jgi:hypothetical protein
MRDTPRLPQALCPDRKTLRLHELPLHRGIKNAAKQKPGIRELIMASAKFFRKQAEKCAEMARRTNDEDSRERCERLERTYCYLAEMEEGQAGDPEHRPAA